MDYDVDWSLYDFDDRKKDEVKKTPVSTCPHCGKKLGRGGHFHVKHCNDSARKA